jgi:hypothetical protein
MMGIRLVVLFSFVVTNCFGQEENFDFKDLKFRGLDCNTTELAIEKAVGKGNKVALIDEDYACFIFYPVAEEIIYHLNYEGFTFSGNIEKGYFLNYLDFDAAGKMQLAYKDKLLSGLTTKTDFYKIFDDVAKEYFNYPDPNQDTVIIYTDYSETGAQFTFKNGRLVKFYYWHLC